MLALLFFFLKAKSPEENKKNFIANNLVSEVPKETEMKDYTSEEIIFVHLSGEVKYPGLVQLKTGARLYEAIEIAGGLSDAADINQINLAAILSDEDKIYIPKEGENATVYSSKNEKSEIININTASKEELMTLPGIGEKTADSILEYRSKNRFEKIEDIMDVPGIGEGKFKQIESKITK